MTGRAQSYLLVAGMRHLLIGVCCILVPRWFTSPSYDQIKALAPGGLFAWGVVGTLVGLGCIAAAAFKHVGLARGGLLASAVVTSLWAGGLFAAMLEGNLTGPTGPVIWTALTLKDLVVCRQPMRSPFEPLVREVLARRDARRGTRGWSI
jgi:hypothetical protein